MLAMALLLPGGHLGGLGGNARQVGGSGEGVLTPRLLTQLQPGYCTLVGTSTSGPHRVCAGAAAGACACATGTQLYTVKALYNEYMKVWVNDGGEGGVLVAQALAIR